MTTNIHQNNAFRNVGMLEIVNEPIQDADQVSSMRTSYYPNAFKVCFSALKIHKMRKRKAKWIYIRYSKTTLQRIRAAEQSLGITSNNQLHIQMMNALWGSGDPNESLTDLWFAAYDDHRYLKWDGSVAVSKDNYIATSCNDNRGGNWPTIVGEWSLSPPDDVQWNSNWAPDTNKDFYSKWFAAQVIAYEKQDGWIFWTWKSQLGDYRWSYQGMYA